MLTATGFVNVKWRFSTLYRIDTPRPIAKQLSLVITSETLYSCAKFGYWCSTFDNMKVSIDLFGTFRLKTTEFQMGAISTKPPKAHPWVSPRRLTLSHQAWKSVEWSDLEVSFQKCRPPINKELVRPILHSFAQKPPPTDLHQILHCSRDRWLNHLWQLLAIC